MGDRGTVCDLLLTGGYVVAQDCSGTTDVAITGTVISGLGIGPWEAATIIDATGLVVLPGGVDPHCHLNSDWPPSSRPPPLDRRPADDFDSGSRAALAGGVTTVCDFVYAYDGEPLGEAVSRVVDVASRSSRVDFSLHVVIGALDEATFREVPALVEAGFPSFKFYTQADDFAVRSPDYIRMLATIGDSRGTAMFHCEDRGILEYSRKTLLEAGRSSPKSFPDSKPVEAEVAATAQALTYASVAGVRPYIVHLSAGAALDQVRIARGRGQEVIAETRPLYLHLTAKEYES